MIQNFQSLQDLLRDTLTVVFLYHNPNKIKVNRRKCHCKNSSIHWPHKHWCTSFSFWTHNLKIQAQVASRIIRMASSISTQSLLLMHSSRTSSYPSSASAFFLKNPVRNGEVCGFPRVERKFRKLRAMLQETVQGPSAIYAREMERLSAKESLLLAVSFSFLFNLKIPFFSWFL